MKTLALFLAIASTGSLAGEVGAPNQQEANAELALATQETGASTSWAIEPFENMATTYQVQQLHSSIDELNKKIALSLDKTIAEKLELRVKQ